MLNCNKQVGVCNSGVKENFKISMIAVKVILKN